MKAACILLLFQLVALAVAIGAFMGNFNAIGLAACASGVIGLPVLVLVIPSHWWRI